MFQYADTDHPPEGEEKVGRMYNNTFNNTIFCIFKDFLIWVQMKAFCYFTAV